jgi:hypothetical protein
MAEQPGPACFPYSLLAIRHSPFLKPRRWENDTP